MSFRLLLVLLGIGTTAAQQASTPPITAPYAGAIVAEIKGRVSIELPSQSLAIPTRGQTLPPETTINTDEGRLLLRLSDGSDVLVRPHTRLVLKQPETSNWRYLQLLLGRIHSEIQKHLGGTPPLQIGTPTAVISVRGTRFDVEVNRIGVTEVDVQEGVVELDSASGRGQPAMITAGFSSRVGGDSGPESPRPTHDLRPELERPSRHDDHDPGDDDLEKKLASNSHNRQDQTGPGDGDNGNNNDDSSPGQGHGIGKGGPPDSIQHGNSGVHHATGKPPGK